VIRGLRGAAPVHRPGAVWIGDADVPGAAAVPSVRRELTGFLRGGQVGPSRARRITRAVEAITAR
jgi:hypothetical protein